MWLFWRAKKSKRSPGPKGTGRFIDNIRWWFWDDPSFPGLISRDKFEELRRMALSESENRAFSTALVKYSIVDWAGRSSSRTIEETNYYFEQINKFLVNMRENELSQIDKWIELDWCVDCLDVFKAYLNVLDYWCYPYSWQEIRDARDGRGILVMYGNTPEYCILETDVRWVRGRPYRFIADIKGASWTFDVERPELTITYSVLGKSREDGGPLVCTTTVGFQTMAARLLKRLG
jgi:hypothetical protein